MRITRLIPLVIILGFASLRGEAQVYNFSPIVDNAATEVKDQAHSGTCWSFATTSFIESELLRQGIGEFDLAEMFIVRHNYIERIKDNYYRSGNGNVDQGSVCHMALNIIDKYGIVPQSAYEGKNYQCDVLHDHTEMVAYLKALASTSVELKNRSEEYYEIEKAILDAYLGEVPETFEYKGKEYTPKSFAEFLKFDKDNYIEITSMAHHPFYEQVALEVPDNWDHNRMYNLPLDEFMAVMNRALEKGFTIDWDGDVSEIGYIYRMGIAILPADKNLTREEIMETESILPEIKVDQAVRQAGYDSFETTDDHLEHITGMAKDQNGTIYYKVKNSWNKSNLYDGYHYFSESYMRAKTISILLHKDALSKDMKKKLGIK